MAKVISGNHAWSAVIRCAESSYGGKVDGCFSTIEISAEDIQKHTDWEGDTSYSVKCPACGQILYPYWQVGEEALSNAYGSKHPK